jgi:MFS family permease
MSGGWTMGRRRDTNLAAHGTRGSAVPESPAKSRIFNYENAVLLVMSLANGVLALDRGVINFLADPIVKELHLSNAQLGLLSSALSITVAFSGFFLASLADATGKRKLIQLITLTLFSVLSASSGLALGFTTLFAARLMMGLAEGPVLPIGQSIMSIVSSDLRRGFNMGVMQTVGAYGIGLILGPIIFTQIGQAFGWRVGFFVSGIPGLLTVLAIAFVVKPLPQAAIKAVAAEAKEERAHPLELFKSRNMLLCLAISGLLSAWLLVQGVFMQRYLVALDHMQLTDTGFLISITGVGGLIGGTIFPGISDRIGRKPMIIFACLGGALAPLAVLMIHDAPMLLAAGLFVGWMIGGAAGPLYVAVIPTESVSPRLSATAVAVSLAFGEILGGVIAPAVAGNIADATTLAAPFWISFACALVSAVLSLFLVETAPRKAMARAATA